MKRKTLTLVLLVIFALSIIGCGGEKIEWPTSGIATLLPEPPTKNGHIYHSDNDSFSVILENVNNKTFKEYVSKCQENGFTVDGEEEQNEFEAYNSDGCKLRITNLSDRMNINLDTSRVDSTYTWPAYGLALNLPVPKSNVGEIVYDSDTQFLVYVGETSMEDFNEYINQCMDKGFTVDYSKGDKYYRADNTDREKIESISVTYEGFNTMRIEINIYSHKNEEETTPEPTEEATPELTEEATPEPTEEVTPEPTQEVTNTPAETADASGVDPEFKSLMDSYEAFFDEFASFMKKYNESADPTALLSDYTSYMQKYNETMKKLNEIDSSSLSVDELAYFSEVHNRITQKIIDAL